MAGSGRHDWVQADLRCMLCGRLEGRVFGQASGRGLAGTPVRLSQFSTFRPAASAGPPLPLTGHEHFRCSICRGPVLLDDVEFFSTYDTVAVDDQPERPRRGRPPKPWRQPRDRRLEELGLAG